LTSRAPRAAQFYDPQETGRIEPVMLGRMLTDLGLGPISDEDLQVLVRAADVNGDGSITLEDFRAMLDSKPVDMTK
jgi:Ca2+-binding EF-hand superfamily protein